MPDKVQYTERRTITQVEYVKTSLNGNPTFRVFFDDGSSAETETDGAVGYGIENAENLNTPVDVTFETSGYYGKADVVIHVKPVEEN